MEIIRKPIIIIIPPITVFAVNASLRNIAERMKANKGKDKAAKEIAKAEIPFWIPET